MTTNPRVFAPAILASILIFSSCQTQESSANTNPPVTIEETTVPVQPPVTSSPTSTTTSTVATVVPTTSNLNPLGGNSPEDFLMPNVLCLSLQEGQDEIQDHGVFFSRSEDATGQGRMQLNDSNWQIVAQSPEPGSAIGEGDAVLYVVKYGESTGGVC
jgi:hypothetical protein